MSFLSQAPPLEGLSPSHGAFQEHAAHNTKWPALLSSKGSSGTCIPEGISAFLHAAFTAHRAGVPTPGRDSAVCRAFYTRTVHQAAQPAADRSVQRLIQRRRWTAPRLARLPGHWFPAPPPSPPQGGALRRSASRKVQGIFPARRSERSRAAEPVKATPFGWLRQP